MELDDHVCYCFHVSKRKIANFIRLTKPTRVSQISECGGAGTGCGWCVPFLKRFYESQQAGQLDEIDATQYAAQRDEYIQAGKRRK